MIKILISVGIKEWHLYQKMPHAYSYIMGEEGNLYFIN